MTIGIGRNCFGQGALRLFLVGLFIEEGG